MRRLLFKILSGVLAVAVLALAVPVYGFAENDYGEQFGELAYEADVDAAEPTDPPDFLWEHSDAHSEEMSETDDGADLIIPIGPSYIEMPETYMEQGETDIGGGGFSESGGEADIEEAAEAEDGEIINVSMPMTLDFVLDPFEVSGLGQVYSEEFIIENLGSGDVMVKFTDITVKFASEADDFRPLSEPFSGGWGDSMRAIYLLLDFGREGIAPVVATAQNGETVSIILGAQGSGETECGSEVEAEAETDGSQETESSSATEGSPETGGGPETEGSTETEVSDKPEDSLEPEVGDGEAGGGDAHNPHYLALSISGSINPYPFVAWEYGEVSISIKYMFEPIVDTDANVEETDAEGIGSDADGTGFANNESTAAPAEAYTAASEPAHERLEEASIQITTNDFDGQMAALIQEDNEPGVMETEPEGRIAVPEQEYQNEREEPMPDSPIEEVKRD